jgi:serine/threonine protein phosphatase 1
MSKIQKIPANTVGVDYICGDIHGCFGKLQQSLELVEFDETVDRLFALGDLIDRGPDNHLALEYLNKPWFNSILGNHELLLCEAVYNKYRGRWADVWFTNGGRWGVIDKQYTFECFDAFRQLPLAIELELPGDKSVGLVHAEFDSNVMANWPSLVTRLDGIRADEFSFDNNRVVEMMVWNRNKRKMANTIFNRPGDRVQQPIQGIDHIFHGHDIVNRIESVGNCTYIDTGSFANSGWVTVVNPLDYV